MDFSDPTALVDYAKSLDCIHCGLCLTSCPTFRVSGVESSSPRGRIHLMRGVAEGRLEPDRAYAEELDYCLLCRNCESVCPAGVRFGSMMEHARDATSQVVKRGLAARFARWAGLRVLLRSRALLGVARIGTAVLQRTGLAGLVARFGGLAGGLGTLPTVSFARGVPKQAMPASPARGSVWVYEGCVLPEVFPEVARDTLSSLAAFGFEARMLPRSTCCGSLSAHNGDLDGARASAYDLIAALEATGDDAPLVLNSAGCSAHMKELAHLFGDDDPWKPRAERAAARIVDLAEFLAPRLEHAPPMSWPDSKPVTWDDPCHLCHGQGVRDEPRAVLAKAGVPLVPLANSEACCGSAGLYATLRPADAAQVFEPKREAFQASGAKVLVTANPGCHLQWRAGLKDLDVEVVHLATVVARSISGS